MFDHGIEHMDEDMIMLQTNLDDMNPELCSYVGDLLFEAGANDVFWIPIIMKKGRPGVMLNVFIHESHVRVMEDIIFRETTTLGLRYIRAACHRLGREWTTVETAWGPIRVKVGYHRGQLVQYAPEFRECEEAARCSGVPLKQIYDEVRRRFMERTERGE
jgi:pyridinium-3,5-bisthiocarboxylic acid mononucleotide nickel chelatase